MRIGAVIVSYNSQGHIGRCLEACSEYRTSLRCGVVVIDNASRDRTVEEAGASGFARVVANDTNRGFAAAVNQGFSVLSDADAVLLLNPDTSITTDPQVLAEELVEHSQIAVLAGQLLGSDGLPQRGFQIRRFPRPVDLCMETLGLNRLWPSNPINRTYRALDLDPCQPCDVEQPAGACLVIRRDAWLAVGGFDEGYYPLWFEDVDFLLRLRMAGWRIRYNPQFKALHAGGHSIDSISWSERQLYWYGGLLRFTARHFSLLGRRLVCCAVICGQVPRLITGMATSRSTKPLGVFVKVVRLALSYLGWGTFGGGLPGKTSAGFER